MKVDDFIVYDIYEDRQAFNRKQGGKYKIALSLKDNIDLSRLKTFKVAKVAFVRSGQVTTLSINFNVFS